MHVTVYDPEGSCCSWLAQHSYVHNLSVSGKRNILVYLVVNLKKNSIIATNVRRKCVEQKLNNLICKAQLSQAITFSCFQKIGQLKSA